jgi:hypothetical protein
MQAVSKTEGHNIDVSRAFRHDYFPSTEKTKSTLPGISSNFP